MIQLIVLTRFKQRLNMKNNYENVRGGIYI